jgi:hypothetical protein
VPLRLPAASSRPSLRQLTIELDEGCYFWTGTTWEERSDRSWRLPGFTQDDHHPVTCVDLKPPKLTSPGCPKRRASPTACLPRRTANMRLAPERPHRFGGDLRLPPTLPTTNGLPYQQGDRGEWRQATVRVDSFRPMRGAYTMSRQCLGLDRGLLERNECGQSGDGSARLTADCTWRVARGGAWNYAPNYLRAAFRYWNLPFNRSGVRGLPGSSRAIEALASPGRHRAVAAAFRLARQLYVNQGSYDQAEYVLAQSASAGAPTAQRPTALTAQS